MFYIYSWSSEQWIKEVIWLCSLCLMVYFLDKVTIHYVADLGHSRLEACQEIQIRNRPLTRSSIQSARDNSNFASECLSSELWMSFTAGPKSTITCVCSYLTTSHQTDMLIKWKISIHSVMSIKTHDLSTFDCLIRHYNTEAITSAW